MPHRVSGPTEDPNTSARSTEAQAAGALAVLLLQAVTRLNELSPGAGDDLLAEAYAPLANARGEGSEASRLR